MTTREGDPMTRTTSDPPIERAFSLTLLRMVLGSILFIEGTGKLWGWFDGAGLEATRLFYDRLHVPLSPHHALIVGSIEGLGGILLFTGLLTRLAVFAIALTFVGALWIIAVRSGSVHNGHLIGFATSLVILQFGSGPWSLDGLFGRTAQTAHKGNT